ncbi:hypothetical protein PFLU3_56850 [Pseudomonas fluorescens]|uniref:Uncharacterized protein n=1 Tax=Pseudomonas fluorescens TaxID=294 RepID=A0A0D0SV72_PSEFL|nr:hypothetical protein PFLU3_56850 [Pseudomonas fluorescens]
MHVAHRGVVAPDGEHGGEVEHAVEVDGRVVTDQFQFKFERLGKAFFKGERDHFKGIAPQRFEGVTQVALTGHETSLW